MRLIDQKRKKCAISIGIVVLIIAILVGIKIKKNSTMAAVKNADTLGANSKLNSEFEEIISDAEVGEVLIQEEEEKELTEEEIEEGKKNISADSKYYIKVNYQANVVTIYQKKDDGEYAPIKAMTCSTGVATPRSGVYSIQGKWTWGALFGNVWGHYVTKIVGNILFHSVPYLSADPGSLEYWEYDKLGTSASAGCVRLTVADAQWIFNNMPSGTPVEFYASSDPGPLGKPGTRKISDNVECRDWDPTDPDPNNPWRNVKEEVKEEQNQKENEEKDKKETQNTNTVVKDTNNNNNTSNGNNTNNTVDNSESEESLNENEVNENVTTEEPSNENDNSENNQESGNSDNQTQEETNNNNDNEVVEESENQE